MIQKNTPEKSQKVQFAVDGRIMFSNSKTESILLTVQPGEQIPEHANPFDVLFIGIQGIASITGQSRSFTLEPCQTLFISGDEPRQLQNRTSTIVKLMVIKIF